MLCVVAFRALAPLWGTMPDFRVTRIIMSIWTFFTVSLLIYVLKCSTQSDRDDCETSPDTLIPRLVPHCLEEISPREVN